MRSFCQRTRVNITKGAAVSCCPHACLPACLPSRLPAFVRVNIHRQSRFRPIQSLVAGKVGIVSGSATYTGAAYYVCRGAWNTVCMSLQVHKYTCFFHQGVDFVHLWTTEPAARGLKVMLPYVVIHACVSRPATAPSDLFHRINWKVLSYGGTPWTLGSLEAD